MIKFMSCSHCKQNHLTSTVWFWLRRIPALNLGWALDAHCTCLISVFCRSGTFWMTGLLRSHGWMITVWVLVHRRSRNADIGCWAWHAYRNGAHCQQCCDCSAGNSYSWKWLPLWNNEVLFIGLGIVVETGKKVWNNSRANYYRYLLTSNITARC